MKPLNCLALLIIAALTLPTILSAGPSIHDYTQAIEDSPEDMKYKFYLLRGRAYKDSGKLDFALKDLNTSIKLNPGRKAYKYRGQVYFEKERYADAINDFTAALDINPSLELYKLRGESYLKADNDVVALADGFKIIEMAPNDSDSYYISMEALENLGDIKLARILAFKVIAFDQTNIKANRIITKYPLKFTYIGTNPIVLYISQENKSITNIANEIFLKYKKGGSVDEKLKKKLGECGEIGMKIKGYEPQLNELWNKYFEEVSALKVRSKKIHDALRDKYKKLSKVIEDEKAVWEDKSKKCTEELVQEFWTHG